jgi:hypothetical protein
MLPFRAMLRRRLIRRAALTVGVCLLLAAVAFAGLSWRLTRGPISLDLATPWLAQAIQDKLGRQQRVEVGGTQIERSSNGKTALRLLDVTLRDGDGSVVASAPKVEVGLSGIGLLAGQIRAERISLVGAEVSVRIDTDGKVTVFAGGNKRPIATAAPAAIAAPAPAGGGAKPDEEPASLYRAGADGFAAALAWIDGLSRTGLDGRDLSEIGLKDGTLVVEDQREGIRWTFDNINVSMKRPLGGGVQFKIESGQSNRRWSIDAVATPMRGNRRSLRLEARRVPARDLLLALRFADLPIKADLPVSVRLHAEIGAAGALEELQGAVVAETGVVGGEGDGQATIPLQHASINFEWNAARRALLVPLQVVLDGNRFTLLGRVDAPVNPLDPWRVQLGGGSIVLGADTRTPLVLNRIHVNGRFEPNKQAIRIDNAELGNAETGLALSGGYFYTDAPRLRVGLATRRMSLPTMLRLWPAFAARHVREWVVEHASQATVERVDIAINAPLDTLAVGGPPIPDDALSVSVGLSDTVFRPVNYLPEIRNADLDIKVTGRTATVKLNHGTMSLPSGRSLALSDSAFDIADTHPHPAMSRTRLRIEGPVAAAAELLATDRLHQALDAPLDAESSRGTFTARLMLGVPLPAGDADIDYALDAEFTNFAADRVLMGQRIEAASLRLAADKAGYRIKGDVKIAGTPASLDYRKRYGLGQDEVRLQAVLDEATRAKLGIDLSPALRGPVPVKVSGRIGDSAKNGNFAVEADLTGAEIDQLLPGLTKPRGKSARATFTLVTKADTTRVEDLIFDGSGATVRGNVVVDGTGSVLSANFPVFSLSNGDKASLRAERASNGSLHATLRGDVLDGRPFITSILAGNEDSKEDGNAKPRDFDLDAKVGAVAGHHGEALRGVELKMSRRDGRIRSFALKASLGRNATLVGDLRQSRAGRQQKLYLETNDAGALFRFADTYSRMRGGRLAVMMDPPSSGAAPQEGAITINDFVVRSEPALDRIIAGAPQGDRGSVEFTSLRVDFTRSPGHLAVREGVLRGPLIGGTIDGTIDYNRDQVRMRGTLLPLYGLNNMFGQLPIVGLFLGGGRNEGLVGITYEVSGPLAAPVLRVNPMSVVAPGFLRKFMEFPSANGIRPPASAYDSGR